MTCPNCSAPIDTNITPLQCDTYGCTVTQEELEATFLAEEYDNILESLSAIRDSVSPTETANPISEHCPIADTNISAPTPASAPPISTSQAMELILDLSREREVNAQTFYANLRDHTSSQINAFRQAQADIEQRIVESRNHHRSHRI